MKPSPTTTVRLLPSVLPPHAPLQTLTHLLFSSSGSLDDLETHLAPFAPSITPSLISTLLSTTPISPSLLSSRRLLRFLTWSNHLRPLPLPVLSLALRSFSLRRDLLALSLLLQSHSSALLLDPDTFQSVVESLVKSGRESDAVRIFRNLENSDSGDRSSGRILSIVRALCEKGHARKAEGVVWHHKRIIEDGGIKVDVYRHLLHGWCAGKNAGEARRVLEEMRSAGMDPGLGCYNDFLRCVCDRNVRFNPSALVPEADDVLREMRRCGMAPTAVSYNILLSCLGRKRRVKEACEILDSMSQGRAGCAPDWVCYYLVIRVLFLTERFVRGQRFFKQMVEAGLAPGERFYRDLIGVLCGVERMDHALQLFEEMKKLCSEDCGLTYELLIAKLCRNGEFDMGKRLWDEAVERGVVLHCSADLLDPSKVQVFQLRPKREKSDAKIPKGVAEREKRGGTMKKLKGQRKKKISSA